MIKETPFRHQNFRLFYKVRQETTPRNYLADKT